MIGAWIFQRLGAQRPESPERPRQEPHKQGHDPCQRAGLASKLATGSAAIRREEGDRKRRVRESRRLTDGSLSLFFSAEKGFPPRDGSGFGWRKKHWTRAACILMSFQQLEQRYVQMYSQPFRSSERDDMYCRAANDQHTVLVQLPSYLPT